MRFMQWAPDGGKESGVLGFYIIEIKSLFTLVVLHFDEGTRESFHEHAFNAVTLWLKGRVCEYNRAGPSRKFSAGMLKLTWRRTFHKVNALEPTWALSLRGPWNKTWREDRAGELVTLTNGRKVV